MSIFVEAPATCPHCAAEQSRRHHRSANLDRLSHALDEIADGTFEMAPCAACGKAFRTEHRMLLSSHARRIWIVMHPLADRPRFATLERGVELIFEQSLAAAPPVVADGLRGARPQLIFGQHMLAEAARLLRARLDPRIVECAKLLAARRHMARLMGHGPFELAFEAFADDGALEVAVHRLSDGARLDGLRLPADALGEARGAMTAFRGLYPELFARPYGSATRCLYRGTAPEAR